MADDLTKDQVTMKVYTATYTVVRHLDSMPSEDNFLKMTVDDLLGSLSNPSEQPLMCYIAVTNAINTSLHETGPFANNFDGNWLKGASAKTWKQVVNYVFQNLLALNP
jgi:hypothetical protein